MIPHLVRSLNISNMKLLPNQVTRWESSIKELKTVVTEPLVCVCISSPMFVTSGWHSTEGKMKVPQDMCMHNTHHWPSSTWRSRPVAVVQIVVVTLKNAQDYPSIIIVLLNNYNVMSSYEIIYILINWRRSLCNFWLTGRT